MRRNLISAALLGLLLPAGIALADEDPAGTLNDPAGLEDPAAIDEPTTGVRIADYDRLDTGLEAGDTFDSSSKTVLISKSDDYSGENADPYGDKIAQAGLSTSTTSAGASATLTSGASTSQMATDSSDDRIDLVASEELAASESAEPRDYSRATSAGGALDSRVEQTIEQEALLRSEDIEVSTSGNDVTLTGTVDTLEQADVAAKLVSGVYGVDEVHANITVRDRA